VQLPFLPQQTGAVTLNFSIDPVKSSERDAATEFPPDKITSNPAALNYRQLNEADYAFIKCISAI
jgi:hypothetical protein